MVRPLAAGLGAVLVLVAGADALSTLISTRLRVGRWWPTELAVRVLWRAWVALGSGLRPGARREGWLGVYAVASILVVLGCYVVGLIGGFGLVWWGLAVEGARTPAEAVYFSGVVFLTIGFGEIVPTSGAERALAIVEAATGVGVTALVIAYLPTLYAAYSARETQVSMLDDGTGEAINPVDFLLTHLDPNDPDGLRGELRTWERWAATLLETHTSHPMLALYRSQHTAQSWVTALWVVTDAAAVLVAAAPDTCRREAALLYRRGARVATVLAERLDVTVPTRTGDAEAAGLLRDASTRLAALGLPVAPFDAALDELRTLRATYLPAVAALAAWTAAPPRFAGYDLGPQSQIDLTTGPAA